MAIEPRQRIPQSGEYMTCAEYFQFDAIAPMLKVDEQVGLSIHLITSSGSHTLRPLAFHAIVGTKDGFHLNNASSTLWFSSRQPLLIRSKSRLFL